MLRSNNNIVLNNVQFTFIGFNVKDNNLESIDTMSLIMIIMREDGSSQISSNKWVF